MKFSNQSKTSLQSFILTFFTSLAIFALAAYFIFNAVSANLKQDPTNDNPDISDTPVISPVDDPDQNVGEKDDKVIEGKSFTLLAAGLDITGEAIDALIIIDVDKENKAVTLYPVNTDASVYVGYGTSGSVNVKLADLCKYKDMAYIADKITATTAIQIDYYISLTADGFIKAVDTLNKNGAYSYTVPKDMLHVYSDAPELEQYNIDFKKGEKLTKGIDIYNALRYTSDSESDRMSRQIIIARDSMKYLIVDQMKSVSGTVTLFEALLKAMSECKTNVPIETFITETFDLLVNVPSFVFKSSADFKTATLNFK